MCAHRILHEHIKKLAQVIRPTHKDLRIPKVYHYECPWPAAQNEIYTISAYKVHLLVTPPRLTDRSERMK